MSFLVGEEVLPHIGRLAADRAPRPGGWCRQRAPLARKPQALAIRGNVSPMAA